MGADLAKADTQYLKRQRQGWYFYMAVPRALRGKIESRGRKAKGGGRRPGKPLSAIVVTLGTQSLKEAQQRRWPLVNEWMQTFERAASGAPLSLTEIEALARETYLSSLESMEKHAKLQLGNSDVEALDVFLDHMRDAIVTPEDRYEETVIDLDKHIEEMTDFDIVATDLAAVQRRKVLTLDPGSETYRLLGRALVRANLAALEGRMEALKGQQFEPPVTFLGRHGIDPVTLKPLAPEPAHPKVRIRSSEGMRFSEVAALFLSERQHDKTAKMLEQTRIQHETVYRLFQDYTDDPPLSEVTRSIAADFLTAVSKLDRNWGQAKGAQQSTLQQLLAKSGNGEGLSNRTLNKYSIALSGVFKWARRTGKFDADNPFAEQSRKKADQRTIGWLPYTIEELNKIFAAPVFHVTAEERTKPERHTFETALRWVPLIALYSGMRLGEVCQLRTEDVRHEGEVWYFDVREGDGQSVKSAAGVRKVPVHSMLIQCGFLEYVRALPDGQLFPALRPAGPDKKFSWHFSQRWTAYRRSVGVDRKRLAFHSFRKNFVSALDEARVPRDDIAALVGHERSFSLAVYSAGKSVGELKHIVEKVEYPGLRLAHLHV